MQQRVVSWLEKTQYRNISIMLLIFFSAMACVPHCNTKFDSQTQLQLGLAYLHLHRFSFAEKHLIKAALSSTTQLPAQKALAYLYQLTGRLNEAEHLYQTLIKTHSNLSELYNNYGVFLCQQNRYKEATFEFNTALTYDSKGMFAQKNLTLCQSLARTRLNTNAKKNHLN